MAAPTITLSKATPNRLVLKVVADNSGTAGLITQAQLAAFMVAGPLKDNWTKVLTTQAAMRTALEGGNCELAWNVYTGLGVVQPDVDTDAVSTTKAEVNLVISAATTEGYLIFEHKLTGRGQ